MNAAATRNAVHAKVGDFLAWVFEVWASGKHPHTGYYNEKFHPHSARAEMAGKDLAEGCQFHLGFLVTAQFQQSIAI